MAAPNLPNAVPAADVAAPVLPTAAASSDPAAPILPTSIPQPEIDLVTPTV